MQTILRDYQYDAFKESTYPVKGRFNIPTGGGKTPLEATILITKLGNDINNIGLVLAPRIVLIQQLMAEYRKVAFTPGITIQTEDGDVIFNVTNSYRFIAFHSGDHEPDYSEKWFQIEDGESLKTGSWKEVSTTNIEVLKEELNKAKEAKQIPVVFSTYHSCGKLAEISFNTIINDEAHFLAQEAFNDNYKLVNAKNKYCFTATERHTYSNDGRGLNNSSLYGKLLYKISPIELIKKKYIVGIKLHLQNFNTDDRESTYISEVKEALDKNIQLSSKLPEYKIIVSTPGTAYIKIVEDNIDEFKKYNCPIFTISAKHGSRINGEVVSRHDFLREFKSSSNAIAFHYDILAEGIDIDGITGIVINRIMPESKAYQTFGRGMRIYKPNPELKPNAWVSITAPNADQDMKKFYFNLIDSLTEEGYDPEKLIEETEDKNPGIKNKENTVDDAYGNEERPTLSNKLAEEVLHYIYNKKQMIALEKFNDDSINISDMEHVFSIASDYFKEMEI